MKTKFYDFIKREVDKAYPDLLRPNREQTPEEVIEDFKGMLNHYDERGIANKFMDDMRLLTDGVIELATSEVKAMKDEV